MKRLIQKAALAVLLLSFVVTGHAEVDGKQSYEANCAACHQITGEGVPPAFPALKGSEKVIAEDPTEVITTVLKGNEGTAMMPFAALDDDTLAAILTYIRSSWDNAADEVTADQVGALREE